MNIKIIKILSIMGFFCFLGCNKPNDFKACFSTDKETYLEGEEITFQNCSSFNKGSEGSGVMWIMGDGETLFSFGNEPVTYKYENKGSYKVVLRIGYKEGPSDKIEKTITIVE